jgi:VWFA-related protein
MQRWLFLLITGLLVVSAGAVAIAQQPPTPQPQVPQAQAGQEPLRVNVDLVNVLFTVADKKGKFITNLKKEDFKIYEDERLQSVTNFSNETNLPLTIALLVDTSGSIRDKLRFEQEAATEFFYSTLRKGKDKALVISFDSGVDLLQYFTDDPEKLADAVKKIRAGGGTSIFDAAYLAITEKLSKETGRKLIILISDGDDNSSRISLTEALEAAQKNDVVLYGVSTNTTAYFSSREQEKGDKTMKRMAEETGGRAFFPFKIDDLATNFQEIGEELRSQYTIAYRSGNPIADGSFRKIRIDVANKSLKARSRTGYYAPRASSASSK